MVVSDGKGCHGAVTCSCSARCAACSVGGMVCSSAAATAAAATSTRTGGEEAASPDASCGP